MAGLPSRAVARSVTVHKLGRIGYGRSQWLQRALAAEVRTGRRGDTLLLLEHPPVFTLGRLQSSADNVVASAADIAAAGATVHQSERGGNVTFHGPGQLVAYPLLDLSRFRKSVHWYVSALEQTLIQAAAEFGLEARRGGKDETGVWVDDRKLAAIGVSVSRWVTTCARFRTPPAVRATPARPPCTPVIRHRAFVRSQPVDPAQARRRAECKHGPLFLRDDRAVRTPAQSTRHFYLSRDGAVHRCRPGEGQPTSVEGGWEGATRRESISRGMGEGGKSISTG